MLIFYAVVLSLLIPLSAGMSIWVVFISKERLKSWAYTVVLLGSIESMLIGINSAAHWRYGVAALALAVQLCLFVSVRAILRGRLLPSALQHEPGEGPRSLGAGL